MPLDPQARVYLDQLAALNAPPMNTLPPAVVRTNSEKAPRPPGPDVHSVENRKIPGPDGEIPVRIYTPSGPGPFPALVWFHGGGWVIGSLEYADGAVRHITTMTNCVSVSVDYRLAPESKFPAAAEDCYAATAWVEANATLLNIDVERIAVGGDSAGGNLAAVVPIIARDRGGPKIVQQILDYPVIERDFTTKSYNDNPEGFLLSRDMMIWFWNHYLRNDEDATNPYVAPMHASSHKGLPPALVITAEFDPLRDEAATYAKCLQEAGIPTQHTDYKGMIHGFTGLWFTLDQGMAAIKEISDTLRYAFGIHD
ncbi:alpha/beta hydrolase [Dehalococcoidia bacterium]|nr:alpha/beta hydrolase [Dehalococcoidia bacterium]